MAIVRRKNKKSGGVDWLSITTAMLELEVEYKQRLTEIENRLRHGEVLETPIYAYELID